MTSHELTVTEARAQLADLVNRVAYSGDRIVLTRHGRPMAVLVPVDAAEALAASDDAGSEAPTIEQLPGCWKPHNSTTASPPARPCPRPRVNPGTRPVARNVVSGTDSPLINVHGRPGLGHNRDYLLLWTGGAVSLLGSQMSMVAYPLVALALTGSPTKAGFVGTSALLGQMVFRLPAGALVDRHDRRRTMLVADALRGLVILGVTVALVLGALGLPLLVVAAFTENAMGEFFRPASTAAVRRVIDPAQMPEAVSRSEARSYGATIVGPPLGGLLYGLAQYLPFAADAASYIYSFVSTFLVRTPMQPEPPATTEPQRIITQLTGGVRRALVVG